MTLKDGHGGRVLLSGNRRVISVPPGTLGTYSSTPVDGVSAPFPMEGGGSQSPGEAGLGDSSASFRSLAARNGPFFSLLVFHLWLSDQKITTRGSGHDQAGIQANLSLPAHLKATQVPGIIWQ